MTLGLALPCWATPDDERSAAAAGLKLAARWLIEHQDPDGRWDVDQGARLRERDAPNELGYPYFDAGVTGLATLALLEAPGSDPSTTAAINSALSWLTRKQGRDGSIGIRSRRGFTVYNHAMAARALCAAARHGYPVRPAAQRAINYCLASQNPRGGWKYVARSGKSDASVTACMLLCIREARRAKLTGRLRRSFHWGANQLHSQTDGYKVGYESAGQPGSMLVENTRNFVPQPTLSMAYLHALGGSQEDARALLDAYRDPYPNWPAAKVFGGPRTWPSEVNFYYWYHGSAALQPIGGEPWAQWRPRVLKALLPRQVTRGPQRGSWPPAGEWCLAGGRIYGTAINALTLSVCAR